MQVSQKITFWGNFKKILTTDCFNFKGMATRREFWYFSLANLLIFLIWSIIFILLIIIGGYIYNFQSFDWVFHDINLIFGLGILGLLIIIWGIYLIIPSLALDIRRIRDIGVKNSVVIILIFLSLFIPYIGIILSIIIGVLPSNFLKNKRQEN